MSWDASNARVVREMINQESNRTDQRLKWLTTLQGLLFAALGFAWDKSRLLIFILAFVGVVTAGSVLLSVYYAAKATGRLQRQWYRNRPSDYAGPDVIGISVPRKIEIWLPWFLLPIIFVFTWIAIIWVRCHRQ
jgi:hypothetical protein